MSMDDGRIEKGRSIFERHGAESIDAARDRWWIGIRDAEEEQYEAGEFKQDQSRFRRGFEAALHPECRGKTYENAAPKLRQLHPEIFEDTAFRSGFQRGQAYSAARDKTSASRTSAGGASMTNRPFK